MRLETFLSCQNLKIQENSIWQEVFNNLNFIKDKKTINRPKPTPPLEKRPKVLYATKFEKLIKNPYDIYAEKVLKLKAKKDFQDDNIFATFGTAVHEALDNYIKNYEKLPEKELLEKLLKYGEESFNSNFANKITKELFFIRFKNIANWFIQEDEKIRNDGYKIYSEVKKEYYFEDLDFTIGGKIDRIEEKSVAVYAKFGALKVFFVERGFFCAGFAYFCANGGNICAVRDGFKKALACVHVHFCKLFCALLRYTRF
jgi:ATP-dependent helicase/nuclease subunit B